MVIFKKFESVFSKVPKEVMGELISGGFYKDNKSLSDRIWINNKKLPKDVDYIIQRGVLLKKSNYELAKDLEMYVDPKSKRPWEWKKVYPNISNKNIYYNAQRLARTAINHSYFFSNLRSCRRNPFVEAMYWELSSSHYDRQVKKWGEDICDEHVKQNKYKLGKGNFPIDKVPVPHPQCLCSQWAFIPKSLDEIGAELW